MSLAYFNKAVPVIIFNCFFSFSKADDSHVIALKTMYSLLNKCQDIFLDHFASLGVFCEVQRLIDIDNNSEKDILVCISV